MPPTSGAATGALGDDDYVAQVLTNEARDNSLKYSTQGLEVYRPKRPSSGAPKPNTRFLRHIIRETDNHNASLKRKEEREARERMRQLRENASTSSSRDHRRHHRSDERDRDRRDERRERHRSYRRTSTERGRSRRHRRHGSYDSDEDRRRPSRKDKRSGGYERRRHRSYSRSRSRSPRHDRTRHDRHRRSRRSVSPTRARSPERSRKTKYKDDRKNGSREHFSSRHKEPTPEPAMNPSGHESDPLEDIVGPLPAKENQPIRSRGRGAYRPNSSNIDAHFAPDYDPTLDVHLDDEVSTTKSTRRPVAGLMTGDDDWELALEAVRDRARWRQKGEERLREAGFNDSIVERWKGNATSAGDDEGRLDAVKWSKKGEGREWDRGKFVDDDGRVDVKASWGVG